MSDDFLTLEVSRASRRFKRGAHASELEDSFRCIHCRATVSTAPWLSGVQNRNHCPYCLWSRHLDEFQPGDRLACCRGPMEPAGLTIKRAVKKYGGAGELMLIHACRDCSRVSINRIAADDVPEALLDVFERSLSPSSGFTGRIAQEDILPLGRADAALVRARLFGL